MKGGIAMEFLLELLAVAAGVILIVGLIALALTIFGIICSWKIFTKMGADGWKCLIPYYCNWILCECVWGNALVSLAIIVPGILCMFIDGALGILLSIITIIAATATNWKKYKNFGKGTGFCILGLFFPIITEAICAFGNAEYTKPE